MLSDIHSFLKRFPEEMAVIGRLLAGYGELEYGLARLLWAVIGDDIAAMKIIFRTRSEAARIDLVDAAIRHRMIAKGIEDRYGAFIGAIKHCKDIRNQYAHSHWGEGNPSSLFFCNMDQMAKSKTTDLVMDFERIELSLLQEQEAFFDHTYRRMVELKKDYVARSKLPSFRLPPAQKVMREPLLHSPSEGYSLQPTIRGAPQNAE